MQKLRRLKHDIVESGDLVGVHFEDTDGSEALVELTKENARLLVGLWNLIVEAES